MANSVREVFKRISIIADDARMSAIDLESIPAIEITEDEHMALVNFFRTDFKKIDGINITVNYGH